MKPFFAASGAPKMAPSYVIANASRSVRRDLTVPPVLIEESGRIPM
jgi:hypothetical protein